MAEATTPLRGDGPAWLKDNVVAATAILTLVGYAAVIGTFEGFVPIYPDIGEQGVNLLGHAIAVVNLAATACLLAGWRYVKQGKIEAHAKSMTAAFGLILLFLLLYLPKVGGGGEKRLVDSVPDPIALGYFAMLAIHIILSAIAMPVVVYAFLLGISHTPAELRDSLHPRVGRIAAASWVLSLVLGVVTYVVLNHVYGYEFVPI
jgi:putative membrane protein